jgi:hypothetical protein
MSTKRTPKPVGTIASLRAGVQAVTSEKIEKVSKRPARIAA